MNDLRVGVAGALGRLGRVACAAIAAQPDLRLVAGLARAHDGDRLAAHAPEAPGDALLYDDVSAFFDVGMDVVVDVTTYPATLDVVRGAADAGVAPVIGATGLSEEEIVALTALCERADIGALLVPNFALGAVLLMRFAHEAARYFPAAEIIELHHDTKKDAPSGTAKLTARMMRAANGGRDVPIHSVRLPGLVAHEEVIFGGVGETLTLRHDSLARESFAAGIVLAVRRVRTLRTFVVGLDAVLFAPEAAAS